MRKQQVVGLALGDWWVFGLVVGDRHFLNWLCVIDKCLDWQVLGLTFGDRQKFDLALGD